MSILWETRLQQLEFGRIWGTKTQMFGPKNMEISTRINCLKRRSPLNGEAAGARKRVGGVEGGENWNRVDLT